MLLKILRRPRIFSQDSRCFDRNSHRSLPEGTCMSLSINHYSDLSYSLMLSHSSHIYYSFIYSFIHSFINGCTALCWALASSYSFVIFFTQSIGLLGRRISPSQGRYLHTGQHKHRRNAHTNIHATSGHIYYFSSFSSSMALTALRRPWPLLQFRNHFFTQTVGLLGRVINSSQGRYLHTGQHKQNKRKHRHPYLEWDSNPRSQRSSERRQFMP
jgi:hypothetical protein